MAGIEAVFPSLAGSAILTQTLLWGQLALPLAAGILVLELRENPNVQPEQEMNRVGLLSVLFFAIPISVLLLPIETRSVVIGGWAFCLIFSGYHLVILRRDNPLRLTARRLVLGFSALLPVLTGLLSAYAPVGAVDITPFAVILFALVAGGIFQDEQSALSRLAKAISPTTPEDLPSAWFIIDSNSRIIDLDPESSDLSGYERGRVIGQPLKILFPHVSGALDRLEASKSQFLKIRSDIFEPAGLCRFALRSSPQADPIFHMRQITVQPVKEEDASAASEGVSEVTLANLKKEVALLEIALDATLRGVLITDHSGNMLFRNRQLLRLLDLPDRAMKAEDKNWQETFSRRLRDRQRFLNLVDQILIQKTSETLDIFELSSGRMVECTTRFHYSEDMKTSFRLWCLTDCTEQQRRERELQHLSMHDTLTGMYNRAFFDIRFNQFRTNGMYPISMIMIDVDGLKRVNDDLGHPAGDELLRQAGQILRQACRTEDVVARVGGDEFAILLPRADEGVAEQVMTRIQGLLNLYNIRHPHSSISLSVGYAIAASAREMDDLVIRADETMYENRRVRREARR